MPIQAARGYAVCGLVLLAACAPDAPPPPEGKPPVKDDNASVLAHAGVTAAEDLPIRRLRLEPGQAAAARPFWYVVSLALIDDHRLFACNYADLFWIDLQARRAVRLPKPVDGSWNPTGVAWHGPTARLAIANYNGHNVWICDASNPLEPAALLELRHPEMISPESCSFSADGDLLAVADFTGNGLLVFNARDGRCLWRREVGLGHGVAWDHARGRIWATGLNDRQIHVFDTDGARHARFGGMGWGPGEYLWPTAVDIGPTGDVVVSDPHTGRITLLDAGGRTIGGCGVNGPMPPWFNNPYAAVWINRREVLVADTCKSRIVRLDIHERRIMEIWAQEDIEQLINGQVLDEWDEMAADVAGRITPQPNGLNCEGYCRIGSAVRLPLRSADSDRRWYPCHGWLSAANGADKSLYCLVMLGHGYYLMNAAQAAGDDGEYLILGAANQTTHFLVSPSGVPMAFGLPAGAALQQNHAVYEGRCVPLADVLARRQPRLAAFEAALAAEGSSEADLLVLLADLLGQRADPADPLAAFAAVFELQEDEGFLDRLKPAAPGEARCAVVREYLADLEERPGVPFLQFYVARTMERIFARQCPPP